MIKIYFNYLKWWLGGVLSALLIVTLVRRPDVAMSALAIIFLLLISVRGSMR